MTLATSLPHSPGRHAVRQSKGTQFRIRREDARPRYAFSASLTARVSASTRDTTRGKLATWSSSRETTPTGSC